MDRGTIDVRALLLLAALAAFGAYGCEAGGGSHEGLMLAQAQFLPDNKPGAAKLSILRPAATDGEPWTEEVIEDPESNVFHKAIAFEIAPGDRGILTIGGDAARLVFWRRGAEGWSPDVLWQGEWGGEHNRLRDIEIGDVTGDGQEELVVATHDQGVVLVFERKGGKFEALEIDRKPDIFVHEIELGDADGDGVLEIFATPSARNRGDEKEQPGDIVMFDYADGKFVKTVLEHFPTRHVKEILWASLDPGKERTLFAAVEGEGAMVAGAAGDSSLLKVYRFRDGKAEAEEMTSLPGKLCRFLNCGDTDGDGRRELVASTGYNGIYTVWREDDGWKRKKIVPESVSSGFEHATFLLDWDRDGRDDLFVASDKQNQVNRFHFDPSKNTYAKQTLREMKLDFTWNIMPLPTGF